MKCDDNINPGSIIIALVLVIDFISLFMLIFNFGDSESVRNVIKMTFIFWIGAISGYIVGN